MWWIWRNCLGYFRENGVRMRICGADLSLTGYDESGEPIYLIEYTVGRFPLVLAFSGLFELIELSRDIKTLAFRDRLKTIAQRRKEIFKGGAE